MAPWVRVLEANLVQALLRTPAFHRAVEKVAKNVHRVRYGIPPEEMGGTKLDDANSPSFLKHFTEEVQTQLGRAESKTGTDIAGKHERTVVGRGTQEVEDEGADAVWRTAQRNVEEGHKQSQGFLGEYAAALREQLKSGK